MKSTKIIKMIKRRRKELSDSYKKYIKSLNDCVHYKEKSYSFYNSIPYRIKELNAMLKEISK